MDPSDETPVWVYAVSYSGDRERLLAALDLIGEVHNWYACMPQFVLVASSLVAVDLADNIHETLGEAPKRRIFVIDIEHADRYGWLPKRAWSFMKDPLAAPMRQVK